MGVKGRRQRDVSVGGELADRRVERPVASEAGQQEVVIVDKSFAVMLLAEESDKSIGLGIVGLDGVAVLDELAGVEGDQCG